MDLPDPDWLADEQIAYYQARAPEYDDWWLRTGRYAPDDDFGRRWEAAKRDLEQALRGFEPSGDVEGRPVKTCGGEGDGAVPPAGGDVSTARPVHGGGDVAFTGVARQARDVRYP